MVLIKPIRFCKERAKLDRIPASESELLAITQVDYKESKYGKL
jgi:hypothetical protein